MSIEYLCSKIPEEWGEKIPDSANFEAIGEKIKLMANQLYLDIGEVEHFMNFYNSFANEFNTRANVKMLSTLKAIDETKSEVELKDVPFFGGVEFSLPFTFSNNAGLVKRYNLFIICYTPLKNNQASRAFIRGHEETEAIMHMGLLNYSVLSRLVPRDGNRELIANLGGIYAARKAGISDAEIKNYLKIGKSTFSEDKKSLEEAIRTLVT